MQRRNTIELEFIFLNETFILIEFPDPLVPGRGTWGTGTAVNTIIKTTGEVALSCS